MSWLVCHLPEPPLRGIAEAVGIAWFIVAPGRRGQARRNLRRVAETLAADGRASPRVRAAASSRLALERLVLDAFRHVGRHDLATARTPAVSRALVADRV